MATPFQKQAQQRKILYLGLILVLFSGALLWRRVDADFFGFPVRGIDAQARVLAIREESRGEVELLGSAVRVGLFGSRGLVTCVLWSYAFEAQKKNQWNELELTVRVLTRLQPHFIAPWLFQSWNLAYNVSVEADRPRDKYFYVSRGIELLARGERQNANHPDLRWSVGFYTMHKIGRSDETNYMRSLLQLSTIPPNERDPARFWKPVEGGESQFDYEQFAQFCKDHPQLVRRLREGMHRDKDAERKKLFVCERPEDVVQFLEDNYQVPGLYRTEALAAPTGSRPWLPAASEAMLPELERFPSMPPRVADRDELSAASRLGDEVDSFSVAGSWFSYSLEPLPEPGELPGSSLPITDRARQRRPKHMTTLIFRNYPAQARRYHAERLQEEGWYDEEPWDASDRFPKTPLEGLKLQVGGGRNWSEDAWTSAYRAWREHGEANKLLFESQEKEQNMRDRAAKLPAGPDGRAIVPAGPLDATREDARKAAVYLAEYRFYRDVSNFAHHLNRCFVERNPETVAARKAFFVAQRLNYDGQPGRALNVYRNPQESKGWPGQKISPVAAWRDLVLKKNKEFRRDSFTQEATAEMQLRYLLLDNRYGDGAELRRKLTPASAVVPLLPPLRLDDIRFPLVPGPFDGKDEEGVPYVPDSVMDIATTRMNLPSRRNPSGGPPAGPPAVAPVGGKEKD